MISNMNSKCKRNILCILETETVPPPFHADFNNVKLIDQSLFLLLFLFGHFYDENRALRTF